MFVNPSLKLLSSAKIPLSYFSPFKSETKDKSLSECSIRFDARNYSSDGAKCYKSDKKKQYKKACYVIFDLDGTLIDTEPLNVCAHEWYLAKYKKTYPWDLRVKVMGTGDVRGAEIIIEELELKMKPEQYIHGVWQKKRGYYAQKIPLLAGVQSLICHLSDHKVPMALVTSSGKKSFELKSRPHKKLFSKFCHVVLGDDPEIHKLKPHPEIYEIAAHRFLSPPLDMGNVLVIEDSPNGVKAAKAAGMTVLMVPDLELPEKYKKGADMILESLVDINTEEFKLPKL